MKLDCIATLIFRKETGKDDNGNPVFEVSDKEVFGVLSSIGQREFYRARQQGLKPEVRLTVYADEGEGAEFMRVDRVLYKVLRSYRPSPDKLELIGERCFSNV